MSAPQSCWRVCLGRAAAALLIVFALAPFGPIQAGPHPSVSDVRLGDHGHKTRFVIELDSNVSYSVFTLADPYRVVIDMEEVRWAFGGGEAGSGRGLVERFRYGLFQPGRSRVVLDVSKPVRIQNEFLLPPQMGKGHRLVIDLASTDPVSFAKTAGWPEALREKVEDRREARLAALTPGTGVAPVPPVAPRNGSAIVPPKKPVRHRPVIVIDPGHGGVDPGAIGRSGTYEKTVVLDVGRRLRDALARTGRYNVHLTRDRDIFVRLRDRVDIARRQKADLFISIHADSIDHRGVRGAAVYTLSEKASDDEAAALAARENRSDIIAGVDLDGETDAVVKSILIDLAQRETKNMSVQFARALLPPLGRSATLRKNSHRYAGFRVLKAPDVPSVLIELGYLSNKSDEAMLSSASGRDRLARSIADAVDSYFR